MYRVCKEMAKGQREEEKGESGRQTQLGRPEKKM